MCRNGSYCIKVSNVAFLLPQVHVHRRGSDNLLKIIPARVLPKEYGGEAGPLIDHWGKDLNVLSLPECVHKTKLVFSCLRFISTRTLNLQVNSHYYQRPCHNDHH
jgi:hypothetical protein